MDLQRLNPWNWFEHEETVGGQRRVPAKRGRTTGGSALHPVMQLHQEIDRLFDDAFSGFGWPSLRSELSQESSLLGETSFRPKLNVSSDNNSYQISLEAPGVREEDLDVQVSNGILALRGEKKEEKESKEKHYYRVERSYGSFQRTLSLPEDAVSDEIHAKMEDGVLNITIPRRGVVEGKAKKIEINK